MIWQQDFYSLSTYSSLELELELELDLDLVACFWFVKFCYAALVVLVLVVGV